MKSSDNRRNSDKLYTNTSFLPVLSPVVLQSLCAAGVFENVRLSAFFFKKCIVKTNCVATKMKSDVILSEKLKKKDATNSFLRQKSFQNIITVKLKLSVKGTL